MRPLRVVTLNLASGRGARGQMLPVSALTEAVGALRGHEADVVALQEVDRGQERSGLVDQAALVAGALGLDHWRFAPTLLGTPGPLRTWVEVAGRLDGPDGHDGHDGPDGPAGAGAPAGSEAPGAPGPAAYGVALLSRHPVTAWHALPLTAGPARLPLRAADPRTGAMRWWTFPDEPRVALAAEIADPQDASGRAVTVACTHLSFAPPTARRQLRAVRRWLAGVGPVGGLRLLAGDLNLPAALLPRDVTPLVRVATFPALDPRLQLDHVVALGGPAVRARGEALALACGDHRGLLAAVTDAPAAP